MGFWSTLLVALRFRSAALPVAIEPLHRHRVQIDLLARHRLKIDSAKVFRFVNDIEQAPRVRLEAR